MQNLSAKRIWKTTCRLKLPEIGINLLSLYKCIILHTNICTFSVSFNKSTLLKLDCNCMTLKSSSNVVLRIGHGTTVHYQRPTRIHAPARKSEARMSLLWRIWWLVFQLESIEVLPSSQIHTLRHPFFIFFLAHFSSFWRWLGRASQFKSPPPLVKWRHRIMEPSSLPLIW